MRGKAILVFVGKSAAFALISVSSGAYSDFYRKLLDPAITAQFISSVRESAKSQSRWTHMTSKQEKCSEQLERTAQQQERAASLLETQERLYAEQEQLQKRFAAILDKWERIPASEAA
jgi:RecA-family ATPase